MAVDGTLRRPEALTEAELAAVADLERRVVGVDGGRLKLGWPFLRRMPGEPVAVALYAEDEQLLGFVGTYTFAAVPELVGMVDPTVRRRGLGSRLLTDALTTLGVAGEREALIVCPRTGAGGSDFARARGGRADHSEHALTLRGGPRPAPEQPGVTLRAATPADATTVRRLLADGFAFDPGEVAMADAGHVLVERAGEVVGYLRAELDGQRGDIYGFVIRRDLRGQGLGRDVLCRASRDLFRRGARTVGLEVETSNEHALGLYTSVGFEQVVTEDYYRLTVPQVAR